MHEVFHFIDFLFMFIWMTFKSKPHKQGLYCLVLNLQMHYKTSVCFLLSKV